MRKEFRIYGKRDMRSTFSSFTIIAKAASVIPIAKEPVFPTKIFPLKLKYAIRMYTANGIYNKILCREVIINPSITKEGQIVSNPFSPPNMFIVLVVTVKIPGITNR
jgi:hypothetical protein